VTQGEGINTSKKAIELNTTFKWEAGERMLQLAYSTCMVSKAGNTGRSGVASDFHSGGHPLESRSEHGVFCVSWFPSVLPRKYSDITSN
jgi:hypothetical protein